jgi:predicted RNA-binding protein
MSNYWLVSWTRDNFDIYKHRGFDVAGFPDNRENIAKHMEVGDRIVVHIQGEQSLVAICECISGYRHDTTPIWVDAIYSHRILTKVITEGIINYRNIRNELDLTKKGKIPPGGELRGSPRKITYDDYKIIESNFSPISLTKSLEKPPDKEISETPRVYLTPHQELIEIISNIGQYLGKSIEREWRVAEFRHDVVWKEKPFRTPSVVFEVCDSGSLEKDILALEWAGVNLPATAILVVAKDNDFDHASRRIPAESKTLVVKGQSIKMLYELMQDNLKLLRAVF